MGTAFDMHMDGDESKIGIIPRAVEHLFMGIEERRQKAQDAGGPVPEFTVNTQFMEVFKLYSAILFLSLINSFSHCIVNQTELCKFQIEAEFLE